MNLLGIDIGSSSTKAVLVDGSLNLHESREWINRGNPIKALQSALAHFLEGRGDRPFRIGITGAGRNLVQAPPEVAVVNEVIALASGAAQFFPGTRSIIEIGAQTSRWLLLSPEEGQVSEPEILDFALNDACATGSGSFLVQQASRLKLPIEEFGILAATARKGANIAGRCSVFAKTDMIHLQQKGTPLEEIAYGLCLALVRNFSATVLKGREAAPPILLAGGGARNPGLVRAVREFLQAHEDSLKIAGSPQFLCALGAAAGAFRNGRDLAASAHGITLGPRESRRSARSLPLGALASVRPEEPTPPPGEPVDGNLGVDIGSVSTNLVVVDGSGEVRAGVYLPTKGRPLEVLREGFRLLREMCRGGLTLRGIGTTGSGRHLAGSLLRADVVHNEITCQLRSAVHYFPEVDTVFEIGGQDSKFISAREGKIQDFAMNKICAAGTGSFLEEQAEILGVRIEDEFSRLAAASASPLDLSSRCTVFMESEIADALDRGVPVPDISAGLAFSIARNYLEKVVAGRPVGKNIVFQGGVASNPAVVRAFALELERDVRVHPHNRISGAIGAALLAREKVEKAGKTSPDADAVGERLRKEAVVTSFTCSHCSNRCHVNRIAFEDETVFFGDTCERYTSGSPSRRAAKTEAGASPSAPVLDLFAERDEIARRSLRNPPRPFLTIGLPRASVLSEFLPFWATFFNSLGAAVTVSPPSNSEILESGLRKLPAETCLPIKIAFGHLEWFRGRGADPVFFPSFIDRHGNPEDSVSFCAYTENFPFMARAAGDHEILSPSIDMNAGPDDFLRSLGGIRKRLGRSDAEIRAAHGAAVAAQKSFFSTLRARGREVLDGCDIERTPVWAVIGRPYTLHDAFLNLNLGRHLSKLGVLALPIDFLPLEGKEGLEWPGAPHWRYNRQAIRAALWASSRPGVHPVVLTNFGCGLDAFNLRHVLKIVSEKPHLVLEFDEHRAEAGLVTRLEAFLDEVGEGRTRRPVSPRSAGEPPRGQGRPEEWWKGRKFVLPYFADHVYAFSGSLKGIGLEAEVLPLPDEETVALGEKHSTGKECHAYSIIAGDFVRFGRSARRGDEVFFFPGTKYACVLNQYDKGLNYLAEDLGFEGLEALAPSVELLSRVLGMRGLKLLWQGLVAIDLLVRASCAIRPYETRKGATDEAHVRNLADIESGLSAGDIGPALKRSAERLKAVEKKKEKRPVVGIAGDVYTRINPVANHGLFLKLEELGCEVRPSSFFVDDVDFGLGRDIRKKLASKRYGKSSIAALLYLRKELEKTKIRMSLSGTAPLLRDPTYNDVLRLSSPYLGLEANNVLLLNIAKMAEFAGKGADGVINAICFNCMLGTVSTAIAGRIREDYGGIPIPTFIYTGSELASEKTKLEAFVYQVKQSAARSGRRKRQERKRRRIALRPSKPPAENVKEIS